MQSAKRMFNEHNSKYPHRLPTLGREMERMPNAQNELVWNGSSTWISCVFSVGSLIFVEGIVAAAKNGGLSHFQKWLSECLKHPLFLEKQCSHRADATSQAPEVDHLAGALFIKRGRWRAFGPCRRHTAQPLWLMRHPRVNETSPEKTGEILFSARTGLV